MRTKNAYKAFNGIILSIDSNNVELYGRMFLNIHL